MLSTRVIACLDVHDGRIVKGINFVDLKDAGDPVEQANLYSKTGADEICFFSSSMCGHFISTWHNFTLYRINR